MACAVLHVTSLPGGGVDRHIRDIAAAGTRTHLVWHTSADADVIEAPGERRYFPLAAAATREAAGALAAWLRSRGVGLVHAHSVSQASRARAAWAMGSLAVPMIATLHDVLFLRAEGLEPGASREPDAQWLAQTAAFLAKAGARIAPSEYLAGVARAHLPGQAIEVIPNGSAQAGLARAPERFRPAERHANPDFAARRKESVAIVLGAIGPHKGARMLEEAARHLEGSDIAIVILGYLDAQIDPGWRGGHLYIHGPCGDEEVPGLVEAYGGRVALFPNQVPESFSYALSDLWAAGLPAIVPAEGALAERVSRHGGGWLLPPRFSAADVAARLKDLLSPGQSGELSRVKSRLRADPRAIPRLEDMTRSLDALYDRFGIEAGAPIDTQSRPAQELLAANLDNGIFRQELSRVADELAQVKAGLEQERAAAQRFATEAREWIAKLERDVAQLQSQLRGEVEERQRLGARSHELGSRVAELEVHAAALAMLPRYLRSWLLRRARDARG